MHAAENTKIWCLHGNLQTTSVWKEFEGRFSIPSQAGKKFARVLAIESEDLWATAAEDFWQWAEIFCDKVQKQSGGYRQILIGYSLGGRLGLHALISNPKLWGAAVLVGAGVGLEDPEFRQRRIVQDEQLARRFEEEPWDVLLSEWDKKKVFGGRPASSVRREEDFSKSAIARLLRNFSLGRQEELSQKLAEIKDVPILYLSGEEDVKFGKVGGELSSRVPSLSHIQVPGACHRVPWESPEVFVSIVQKFFNQSFRVD